MPEPKRPEIPQAANSCSRGKNFVSLACSRCQTSKTIDPRHKSNKATCSHVCHQPPPENPSSPTLPGPPFHRLQMGSRWCNRYTKSAASGNSPASCDLLRMQAPSSHPDISTASARFETYHVREPINPTSIQAEGPPPGRENQSWGRRAAILPACADLVH